jgi:23S rRNA (uracil1939-C5)-methyltransferase
MAARQRTRVQKKEPVLLTTTKLSHEGRGIAHHEGKVVFVDGALAGEEVLVRFTGNRSSYAEAETLEVRVASADRVTPACPHFGVCGGCSLQHLDSSSQLAFKEAVLHERLEHAVAAGSYTRLPVISGAVYGYRRKARLAVRWVGKKGKSLVGFRERSSSFITDMDSCAVLDPRVGVLIPALSALVSALDARDQLPQIEVAIGDQPQTGSTGGDCALVFRHLQPLTPADRDRFVEFGQTHAIDIYLQPQGLDSVHKLFPPEGPMRLWYQLPDYSLTLAFHPLDFTQVNASINRLMLQRALQLLELQPTDRVLDLFCGLGNFTLPIARHAGAVVGVEGAQSMVERGRENAGLNGITNAEFHCADLTQSPEQHAFLRKGFDKILLDPPRSGAQEVLPALVAMKPQRIVYVSCNPATLARDAGVLATLGFQLQAAGAMDMFPHTGHVEAIALFLPVAGRRQ